MEESRLCDRDQQLLPQAFCHLSRSHVARATTSSTILDVSWCQWISSPLLSRGAYKWHMRLYLYYFQKGKGNSKSESQICPLLCVFLSMFMWALTLAHLVTIQESWLTFHRKSLPNNDTPFHYLILLAGEHIRKTKKWLYKCLVIPTDSRSRMSSTQWSFVCVFIPPLRILWGLNITSARWASTLV